VPNSLCAVNGRPAFIYSDPSKTLFYVQAIDHDGTDWKPPVVLLTGQTSFGSLAVVDGQPAVAANDGSEVLFVRAGDPDGVDWGVPQTIGSGSGQVALLEIDGAPAVAFASGADDIQYARAFDADGSQWGNSIVINPGEFYSGPQGLSMAVVDGKPAVSYAGGPYYVDYVEASDADGTSWNSPIAVMYIDRLVPPQTSLADVGGHPALSFSHERNPRLMYAIRY
jgi:hypothetical protein